MFTSFISQSFRIPASSPNIWFVYNKRSQLEQLLENLLQQGLRESALKKKLSERFNASGLLNILGQHEGTASSAASTAASTAAVPTVGSAADPASPSTSAGDAAATASTESKVTASSASNTAFPIFPSIQTVTLAANKQTDQPALNALREIFVSVHNTRSSLTVFR